MIKYNGRIYSIRNVHCRFSVLTVNIETQPIRIECALVRPIEFAIFLYTEKKSGCINWKSDRFNKCVCSKMNESEFLQDLPDEFD